jgi:hypothetical protein
LALNGGIRWLALNGEAVNGRGDMRGKRHSRGGLLGFEGQGEFWRGGEIVLEHFSRGEIEKLHFLVLG